ncbi:MAG: MFS transporter, partial [Pseudomonadota bacterium]
MSSAAASATSSPPAAPATTAWSPFRQRAFAVLWIATVIANVGTWMHDVGAGWLMTELSPSPLVVAMVQAATTAPVFLFALLAGALADIVDRRKMLILVNLFMGLSAAGLALLVSLNLVTPALLILFTFLLGAGAAFSAPAWQAIVPKLVPKQDLTSAIALNSMGINVSRAIGPALAGFLIVTVGLAAPFALNAVSFIGILLALWWWRSPEAPAQTLPPEHVGGAVRAGLAYALNSGPVRATLIRAASFFAFASCYWAMLPLIAREVLQGGPTLYGLLLAAVGAGAVAGALALPIIKKRLGPDGAVAAGALGTAVVLCLFAIAPTPI